MDESRASAALDSVTDHVAEEGGLDGGNMAAAVSTLTQDNSAAEAERRERERQLAAVRINSCDVDLIVSEMELERGVAERKLREADGDVTAALRALVR